MRRRLLNLLTAVSLLLCVAVVVMWVRSYQYSYCAVYQSPRVALVEWHALGCLVGGSVCYESFTCDYSVPPNRPPPSDVGFTYDPPARLEPEEAAIHVRARKSQADNVLLDRAGFHLAHSVYGDSAIPELKHYRRTVVQVPLWFTAIVFAVAPVTVLLRRSKNRSSTLAGCCPSCGYDLTGNVSGVCPECGSQR